MSNETKTRPKLCDGALLLGATLDALLKLNPNEPKLRASVMAVCVRAIPDELTTYDGIIDWIEHNIPPKATGKAGRDKDTIEIELSTTETEIGRCNYTCTRNGDSTVDLELNDLNELAECRNLREIRDRVWEIVNEVVWKNNQTTECNNYDYTDEESKDSSDGEWEFRNRSHVEQSILRWIQENRPTDYNRIMGCSTFYERLMDC